MSLSDRKNKNNNKEKEQLINTSQDIKNMIFFITWKLGQKVYGYEEGVYGIKSQSQITTFDDGTLKLIYQYDGNTKKRHYYAYYNGILVYPINHATFIEWSIKLQAIYDTVLTADETKLQKIREQIRLKAMVQESLKRLYPNYYSDSEIKVENMDKKSSYIVINKGLLVINLYSGVISLTDGTIVYDDKNDIFQPGPWINYLARISSEVETKENNYQLQLKKTSK